MQAPVVDWQCLGNAAISPATERGAIAALSEISHRLESERDGCPEEENVTHEAG